MHRRRTLVVCLLSFAAILLGTGCGSSGNANIRLVNALSNQSSLDMLIDSSSNFVADQTASLGADTYDTALVTSGGTTVLTDSHTAPNSRNISIRVVNASSILGTVDVYVVSSGTSINSVNPTFSSLSFPSASSYASLAPGSYQVIFTPAGQKFAELSSSSLSFSSGQVRTVLGLDIFGGGGVTTSVLSDLN
ncbi:MAG: hypothetical protein DMG93_15775 [Acidobacteria bacterium]|nr:MAG: hypothetical protein DMG93_15775 [Acidobacteriota bacterium]